MLHPQKPELQICLSNCLHVLQWESQGHHVASEKYYFPVPSAVPFTLHPQTHPNLTCFTSTDLHVLCCGGMFSQPAKQRGKLPHFTVTTVNNSQIQPSSLPTHLPAFVGPSILPRDFHKSSLICLFYQSHFQSIGDIVYDMVL